MPISMMVDKNTRTEWFKRIKIDLQDAQQARGQWFENYQVGYKQYRNVLPPKNFPWPDCANLAPPITTRSCEQLIRRIVMFYINNGEFVTLTANSALQEMQEKAQKVQSLLLWQGWNELDYFNFVDSFVREFVIGGSAFAITDWAFEEQIVADMLIPGRARLTTPKAGAPPAYRVIGEPIRRQTPMKAIFDEIFGASSLEIQGSPKKISEKTKGIERYAVQFEEKGRKKMAFVTVDRREELGDNIEVIAEVPRIVKNQPTIKPLTAERAR
jgi:hypothetical protein